MADRLWFLIPEFILLAGVVVAAFFSACVAFILSVSSARTVQSVVL